MKESWQTFLMEFQNPRRIVERIPERISLGIQGEIDDNIPGKRQSKFIKKIPEGNNYNNFERNLWRNSTSNPGGIP